MQVLPNAAPAGGVTLEQAISSLNQCLPLGVPRRHAASPSLPTLLPLPAGTLHSVTEGSAPTPPCPQALEEPALDAPALT